MENIVSSAKTDMFRIRINPVLRKQLEDVYGKNGLTLTDAVNVFFQQSLNAGGFPFEVNENNAEIIKAKATVSACPSSKSTLTWSPSRR